MDKIVILLVGCIALLGIYETAKAADVTADDIKHCAYISNIAAGVQATRQRKGFKEPVEYLETLNVGEELPLYGLITWKVFEGFTEAEKPKDIYKNLFSHCAETYKAIRGGQIEL